MSRGRNVASTEKRENFYNFHKLKESVEILISKMSKKRSVLGVLENHNDNIPKVYNHY